MNIRKHLDWIYILILLFVPTAIWLSIPTFQGNLSTTQNVIVKIGEISGILGITLFSINLILTTRLNILEKLFNGLNNVYKKHSLFGQVGVILLLIHPLLLLPRYATNFKDATTFLTITSNSAKNYGIIALWLFLFLIILTLYLRPKYNIWKLTHKLLGFVLFIGALHVYLIPSQVLNNIFLKSYILTLASIGILSFLYKTIFGRYTIKRSAYIIKHINRLNNEIIEILMSPITNKIEYKAGQFIFLSFKEPDIGSESHPFSISSSPSDEYLKVTIKPLGDFTYKLAKRLTSGTKVDIEGPFGTFNYKQKKQNQIWIAGGIGITPFIGMAKDIVENNEQYNIDLYYATRNENETTYLEFLNSLKPKINLITFYSDHNGRLTSKKISELDNNFANKDILICAPPSMINALRKQFIAIGVKKSNLYSEDFSF